ncbi:MAG: ATP-binding protein [Bacteroidales bacterium]
MIVMVYGLPGTGKSYFSRRLAPELDAVYLNTDIVRKEMGIQGQYDEKSKQRVYDRLLQQMTDHVSKKKNVILDGTFHKKSARDPFIRRSKEMEVDLFLIEIKAGDRTVRRRMQTEREYSEADYKVYQQIKYSFEPVERNHLSLQSDLQGVDEMIAETKQYLHEQRTDRKTC